MVMIFKFGEVTALFVGSLFGTLLMILISSCSIRYVVKPAPYLISKTSGDATFDIEEALLIISGRYRPGWVRSTVCWRKAAAVGEFGPDLTAMPIGDMLLLAAALDLHDFWRLAGGEELELGESSASSTTATKLKLGSIVLEGPIDLEATDGEGALKFTTPISGTEDLDLDRLPPRLLFFEEFAILDFGQNGSVHVMKASQRAPLQYMHAGRNIFIMLCMTVPQLH